MVQSGSHPSKGSGTGVLPASLCHICFCFCHVWALSGSAYLVSSLLRRAVVLAIRFGHPSILACPHIHQARGWRLHSHEDHVLGFQTNTSWRALFGLFFTSFPQNPHFLFPSPTSPFPLVPLQAVLRGAWCLIHHLSY